MVLIAVTGAELTTAGGKLDNKGLRYDELDDIIDTKVLSSYRKEATRIADTFPKIGTEIETAYGEC